MKAFRSGGGQSELAAASRVPEYPEEKRQQMPMVKMEARLAHAVAHAAIGDRLQSLENRVARLLQEAVAHHEEARAEEEAGRIILLHHRRRLHQPRRVVVRGEADAPIHHRHPLHRRAHHLVPDREVADLAEVTAVAGAVESLR